MELIMKLHLLSFITTSILASALAYSAPNIDDVLNSSGIPPFGPVEQSLSQATQNIFELKKEITIQLPAQIARPHNPSQPVILFSEGKPLGVIDLHLMNRNIVLKDELESALESALPRLASGKYCFIAPNRDSLKDNDTQVTIAPFRASISQCSSTEAANSTNGMTAKIWTWEIGNKTNRSVVSTCRLNSENPINPIAMGCIAYHTKEDVSAFDFQKMWQLQTRYSVKSWAKVKAEEEAAEKLRLAAEESKLLNEKILKQQLPADTAIEKELKGAELFVRVENLKVLRPNAKTGAYIHQDGKKLGEMDTKLNLYNYKNSETKIDLKRPYCAVFAEHMLIRPSDTEFSFPKSALIIKDAYYNSRAGSATIKFETDITKADEAVVTAGIMICRNVKTIAELRGALGNEIYVLPASPPEGLELVTPEAKSPSTEEKAPATEAQDKATHTGTQNSEAQ
jgi:hypothetical protein